MRRNKTIILESVASDTVMDPSNKVLFGKRNALEGSHGTYNFVYHSLPLAKNQVLEFGAYADLTIPVMNPSSSLELSKRDAVEEIRLNGLNWSECAIPWDGKVQVYSIKRSKGFTLLGYHDMRVMGDETFNSLLEGTFSSEYIMRKRVLDEFYAASRSFPTSL